jgi:hypothetical protein
MDVMSTRGVCTIQALPVIESLFLVELTGQFSGIRLLGYHGDKGLQGGRGWLFKHLLVQLQDGDLVYIYGD